VYLLVTRTTKTHKVRLVIRSSLGERDDVVVFLHGDVASLLQAHLAERMLVDVAVRMRCQDLPYRLPVE